MSEYKRIVSYLYKYERGNKGENAGYVRIDVRKGDLKLLVHTQDNKALKDKDFQVYFYHRDGDLLKGVYGGNLRFYQGESEFRRETKEASIFDSGHSLDQMGGLVLYYNKELAYGTEWDDNPILLNQFVEDKVDTNTQQESPKILEETLENQIEETELKPEQEKIEIIEEVIDNITSREQEQVNNSIQEEEEISVPTTVIAEPDSQEKNKKNDWMPFYQPISASPTLVEREESEQQVDDTIEVELQQEDVKEKEQEVQQEALPEEDHVGNLKTTFFDLTGLSIDEETLLGLQAIYQGSSLGKEIYGQKREELIEQEIEEYTQEEPIGIGRKEELYELTDSNEKNQIQEKMSSDTLFANLVEASPKISHPMIHELHNLVRIQPQDLGKLAISNWHFGSNSFVVHGYYQFHYLVIGMMLGEDGVEKAILGVPGIYTNQDKYMALQFGFKQFIPVKPAQIKTGSFGYWVSDLTK